MKAALPGLPAQIGFKIPVGLVDGAFNGSSLLCFLSFHHDLQPRHNEKVRPGILVVRSRWCEVLLLFCCPGLATMFCHVPVALSDLLRRALLWIALLLRVTALFS